jgi:hypothetical protein
MDKLSAEEEKIKSSINQVSLAAAIVDGMTDKSDTVVNLLMQEKPSEDRDWCLDMMKRMKKASKYLDKLEKRQFN